MDDLTFNQNTLWYESPAEDWESEALPVGNGRLGGMVFGGIARERILLNEESIWTGGPDQREKPEAHRHLKKARDLLFAGQYAEGQKYVNEHLMAEVIYDSYQMLGDLFIEMNCHAALDKVRDYKRSLNLDTGIATTTFAFYNTRMSRHVFCSAVDQCLVIRMESDGPGSISASIRLDRPKDRSICMSVNHMLIMEGQVTAGDGDTVGERPGVKYEARLLPRIEGGSISQENCSLVINNADAVTLYLFAATDYRGTVPAEIIEEQLAAIARKGYSKILEDHLKDHRSLFQRVSLEFDNSPNQTVHLSTDRRLQAFSNGSQDLALIALYFQYGRYLLMGSSRPGNLPANLQGIWADGLIPPWSADYHININIQMNYWLAEVANLSELHEPFLNFINQLRENGRKTARNTYDCRGFVAHFATDVWHYTSPAGEPEWAMWPMGAAWCCRHFWEHYEFTGDKVYLEKLAWPVLREAAEFFTEYLVEHPETGFLVSGPSSSPENKFITDDGQIVNLTMGPTMDQQIVKELFLNTLETARILKITDPMMHKLTAMLPRLSPTKIGKDGRLLEWEREFMEQDPGHRHISHLYALHPGEQIDPDSSADLAQAAEKTLNYRLSHGGGHTGWSRAWIINFFARLQNGEKAWENLKALLTHSTLKNLFDTHPPFQIDGNFGAVAGICEMLLQSHAGIIRILPALPQQWPTGKIKGLRARGGLEVDISWQNNNLKEVGIISDTTTEIRISYAGCIKNLKIKSGEIIRLGATDFVINKHD